MKEETQHDTAEQVTGVDPKEITGHQEWRAYSQARDEAEEDRLAEMYREINQRGWT